MLVTRVSMEMEYQHWPLWKNWKIAAILYISIVQNNFKLLAPPQSLGLRFSKCQWKWNISIGHYEKFEKWLPFHKYQSYWKISNYWTPPKVWVSSYPMSHLCVVLHFLIFYWMHVLATCHHSFLLSQWVLWVLVAFLCISWTEWLYIVKNLITSCLSHEIFPVFLLNMLNLRCCMNHSISPAFSFSYK